MIEFVTSLKCYYLLRISKALPVDVIKEISRGLSTSGNGLSNKQQFPAFFKDDF